MNKKVPMRTCIACKTCKPKKELIRIVKTDSGFELDLSAKASGRGSYVCDSIDCIDLLCKSKALNRVYKQNIAPDIYEKIKENYLENR